MLKKATASFQTEGTTSSLLVGKPSHEASEISSRYVFVVGGYFYLPLFTAQASRFAFQHLCCQESAVYGGAYVFCLPS